jgi:gamma-glutamyltranspeptidase/glutathione hydrolase
MAATLLLVGCGGAGHAARHDAGARPGAAWLDEVPAVAAAPRVASGGSQAVATAHPLATVAAWRALEAGGTAVDALVAASIMLTVAEPQSTGIGGGGFAVVWPGQDAPAKVRAAVAVDFRETAPAALRVADYLDAEGRADPRKTRSSGLSVGVPGTIAGLWWLHQRHGRRPWAELVGMAADAARAGLVVTPRLRDAIEVEASRLGPHARARLLPDGSPLAVGARWRMPGLAKALDTIAERGRDGFYAGWVAEDIVAAVRAEGGKMTAEDLASYRVRTGRPLAGDFFGDRILTMPQPSAGGAQLLAMAEAWADAAGRTGAAGVDLRADTGLRGHLLAEVMRASFLLRLAYSGDTPEPARHLDRVYPPAARAMLRARMQLDAPAPSERVDTQRYPRPDAARDPLSPGAAIRGLRAPAPLEEHPETSHIAIVDRDGMAVSSTQTINLRFGSGRVAPKTGIWLNDELDDFSFTLEDANYFGLAGSKANLARPGARPVSSMSPTIVLRDGAAALVVGTPGGTRIPTTVFQIMLAHLQEGASLEAAVAAGRVHHQAFPKQVAVEQGRVPAAVQTGLRRRGQTVSVEPPWCNAQAVSRLGKGAGWTAVSDPRGEGMAAAR